MSKWKAGRQGKHSGVVQGAHVRKNWFNLLLWTHINNAALKVGFSARAIVKYLQRDMRLPNLFADLHPGTVQKWIAESGFGWSERTKERVKDGGELKGSGQKGALHSVPEVVDAARERMRNLRKSGVAVNVIVARAILLALIQANAPDLLKPGGFVCSEVSCALVDMDAILNCALPQTFVRSFLSSQLNWTVRKGTRAAAHIPPDAEKTCSTAWARIVHLLIWYDIPLRVSSSSKYVIVLLIMCATLSQSFSSTWIKQAFTFYHLPIQHMRKRGLNKSMLLARTTNVHTHWLLEARAMAIYFHSSKFGRVNPPNLSLRRQPQAAPRPMNLVLTLLLQTMDPAITAH